MSIMGSGRNGNLHRETVRIVKAVEPRSRKGVACIYILDVISIGSLFLVAYIIIDCIRHKSAHLLHRVLFYSFILYLIFVFQYTTGGLNIPPRGDIFGMQPVQLVPFQFALDMVQSYQSGRGLSWSFRISFYNFIMLLPLGIYCAVIFNVKNIKKAALIIFFVSLTIEIYQLVFSYLGLVYPRSFNVDDIILNTLGGVVGYYISKLVFQKWTHWYIRK